MLNSINTLLANRDSLLAQLQLIEGSTNKAQSQSYSYDKANNSKIPVNISFDHESSATEQHAFLGCLANWISCFKTLNPHLPSELSLCLTQLFKTDNYQLLTATPVNKDDQPTIINRQFDHQHYPELSDPELELVEIRLDAMVSLLFINTTKRAFLSRGYSYRSHNLLTLFNMATDTALFNHQQNYLTGIRSRPGMYAGETSNGGFFFICQLIEELLTALTEQQLTMTLATDAITLSSPSHIAKLPFFCTLLTACALSRHFDWQDSQQRLQFQQGKCVGQSTTSLNQGFKLTFQLDETLFTPQSPINNYDPINNYAKYYQALQKLAALQPNSVIKLVAPQQSNQFYYPNGVADLLQIFLQQPYLYRWSEPLYIEHQTPLWQLQLAMIPLHSFSQATVQMSFVNNQQVMAGSHLDALRQALVELSSTQPQGSQSTDYQAMNYILSLHYPYARYQGSLKLVLDTPEIIEPLKQVIQQQLQHYLTQRISSC